MSAYSRNGSLIRVAITYTSILVAPLLALFRTRREQAVVGLALGQQLAPRFTNNLDLGLPRLIEDSGLRSPDSGRAGAPS